MNGLMMDTQLTLGMVLRRAETLFGHKEIVTRTPDRSLHRYTYADFAERAKRLPVALQSLGVRPGDRVATFCWNNYQHLEAYFGVPAAGAVMHTLNLRLYPDDLAYIATHAEDQVILVDHVLLPVFDTFRAQIHPQHVVVTGAEGELPAGMLDYEQLLTAADPAAYVEAVLDEHAAAAMCYTSGTTGRPKAAVYSHRSIVLHAMASCMADVFGIGESDVILPVVPMFHANAWGLPFAATLAGAKQVFPGPYLDPPSILDLLERERVTFTGAVPTVWLGVLQALDQNPGRYDLSSLRLIPVGGSAVPKSMIQAFEERHGLRVVHAWGMTEMNPLGTIAHLPSDMAGASAEEQYSFRARQGIPVPCVEIRARGDEGLVPWDGETMGELEVRGPWVASGYYRTPEASDRFTADGWFRTGDIVTVDGRGCITIVDRTKDLIKSGGEWISSVALETTLMGHPAVAEAAVVAVPHSRWQERPLAVVVLKPGQTASEADLIAYLAPHFAKWWLPDRVVFVDAIPRTAVGKVLKSALRLEFAHDALGAPQAAP